VEYNDEQIEIVSPKKAYETLKDVQRPEGMLKAKQILERDQLRNKFRGRLQEFENSRARTHDRRTLSIKKTRAYGLLEARERLRMLFEAMKDSPCFEAQDVIDRTTSECTHCHKYHYAPCALGEGLTLYPECPKMAQAHFETLLLYFEGKEGRCVNSPFGGHDRWTGNKLGKMLALNTIVFGVPEPFSSCTCYFCGDRVQKGLRSIVKQRKNKNGVEIAASRVNGTLECRNPECIAFKLGLSLKTRDAESGKFVDILLMLAMLMIIIGLSILLSENQKPLRPFQVAKYGKTNNASSILDRIEQLISGLRNRSNLKSSNGE
jgi:hypothetical protein